MYHNLKKKPFIVIFSTLLLLTPLFYYIFSIIVIIDCTRTKVIKYLIYPIYNIYKPNKMAFCELTYSKNYELIFFSDSTNNGKLDVTTKEISEYLEKNIKKLKVISDRLKANIDFEQIDQLLALAKTNYAQGNFVQNEQTLSNIATDGREIHKLLYEISEQNKIYRAQHFAKKHVERIDDLILQAKEIGLNETVNVLEQSKVQLLQANSTQIIKQQFKITVVYMQKVDHAKEAQQNKFLKLKVIIDSLENNAKRLSNDVEVNSAASSFLDRAFNLIEDVRSDLKDLEYAPTTLRDYSKYIDLTIGNKIKSIKELLIKVERLIYTSS